MNYFAFTGLFVGTASVLSGLAVYLKNPRSERNLSFIPFVTFGAFWSFFYAAWQMSTTYHMALMNIRISIAFAVLIPPANFHYIVKFLGLETPRRRLFLQIYFALAVIIIIFSPTPYFIPRVESRLGLPFWPVPGPLIHLHFISLFVPSLWTLYLLWKQTLTSSPLIRNKLKWLLIAHLVGYTGGISNNPLWYNIPIKPYLNILSASVSIVGASLYFRLSTIDFGYLIRRAFVKVGIFVFIISFVLCTAAFLSASLKIFPLILVTSVMTGFLVIILYQENWRKILDNFRAKRKDIIEERKVAFREITFTYDDLAQNLVQSMFSILPISMAAVYMVDILKNDLALRSQMGMKNPLSADLRFNRSSLSLPITDPLIQYIEQSKGFVNLEEIADEFEMGKPELAPLVNSMHRLEAEFCAPLYFGDRVRGLLVLGRKTNNTLYNEDDFSSIDSFVQLGTDIMRFIYGMETELNHTALYSHDMNHNIRSLMQAIQFLDSPMAESQTKERIHNVLLQANEVTQQLFTSFQRNRDRSTLIMKTMRGEYEKQTINLGKLLESSAGKFSLQATKDGVMLKTDIQPAAFDMPGNREDLVRVFDNLIANAFRYIKPPEGLLEVIGRNANFSYEIVIRDNGEGIDPQDLSFIWKWGWQASQGKKGDSGLGLAISKQIIQIHNGTIIASSEGKGKGTAFTMNFPLKP